MLKIIFTKIIYYLSLSGFNTFYKYMCVKQTTEDYYLNTEFMGMYKTTSEVKIPYMNIFILSLVTIFLIDFIITIIVFYISKKNIKEVISNLSNYFKYIFLIICSFMAIYISVPLSLFLIIIGLIIYILNLKKYFDRKVLIVISILNVLNLLLLYYISK